MWTPLAVFLLFCAAAAPHASAADACALTLSAASATSWQVACADGSSSSAFDPKLLTDVRIGEFDAVEFKPATAPQPVEVKVPMTFARVDQLISPTLTSFSLQRVATVKKKAAVTIDGSAFAKMTAMEKLYLGFMNLTVDGPLELPPSLNELTIHHGGLVDFNIKIKKGTGLNITTIDLRWNKLQRIPLIVFAIRRAVFINLASNSFPALRLSRRKLRRLLRLIEAKRILLGEVADFTDDCEGEKKTLQLGSSAFLVCEVEADEDDEFVVDGNDDGEGDGSAVGSAGSAPSSPEPSPASSSSSSSSMDGDMSQSPTPSSTSAAPSMSIGSLASVLLAGASTCIVLSSLV